MRWTETARAASRACRCGSRPRSAYSAWASPFEDAPMVSTPPGRGKRDRGPCPRSAGTAHGRVNLAGGTGASCEQGEARARWPPEAYVGVRRGLPARSQRSMAKQIDPVPERRGLDVPPPVMLYSAWALSLPLDTTHRAGDALRAPDPGEGS